ncbi:hypothetical protein BFL40_12090 [Pseudomonas costantinii]|uniref:Adhesin n=1 Tax=Pseudomonas costantinii TaxID=168469 RepID=A0A1S2V3H0_9PSED|nr:hypothetical protein BFL40_12090 [Pseudomonas costantinii]
MSSCIGLIALYSVTTRALTERQTFEVFVRVPTVDFHVLPVEPQLLTHQQTLEWDVSRRVLRPLIAYFDVRSSAGAVNAHLAAAPVMAGATSNFGLEVRFNGNTLAPTVTRAVEVLNEREAGVGKRVTLEILPIPPTNGYSPGLYYGNVKIVFDAVISEGT